MDFDTYGFGASLSKTGELARGARRVGFSTMWFTEAGHNPYLPCAVAAEAAPLLGVGTSIAVAFPRSPMVTAQLAWDLAEQSGGRFQLGLGTQVKAHVKRRFSTEWSGRPAAQMREYIEALRAIFRAFQGEEKLSFKGDYYQFSLLTDFFSGGAIDHPDIPIQIAGVNTGLARLAGEVCDGFHVHPVNSPEYLRDVVRPAVSEGAARAGRSIDDVDFICPVFIAVGDTPDERAPQLDAIRAQISFYASTPSYEPVLAHHGFGDVAAELQKLMRAGDVVAMAALMTDEVIAPFSVSATWDELPRALHARYDGLATSVLSYLSLGSWVSSPERAERWADVVRRFGES